MVLQFATVVNAGDARVRGSQLELTAVPTRNIEIDATLSHMSTELTRVDPTLNVDGLPSQRQSPSFRAGVEGICRPWLDCPLRERQRLVLQG